jgi:hypothetical protein
LVHFLAELDDPEVVTKAQAAPVFFTAQAWFSPIAGTWRRALR